MFNIGSVTKPVTASIVLSALARRDLPVTTQVRAVLGEGPRGLTVAELLAMTDGLTTDFVVAPHDGATTGDRRAAVDRILTEKPAAPPGSRWAYSNNAYLVLGAVAERLTGRSYADLAADALDQSRARTTCAVPERALPYAAEGSAPRRARPASFTVAYSAGGVCTDATTLARFVRTLAASTDWTRMTTPSPDSAAAGNPFGMGLFVGGALPGVAWSYGVNPDPEDSMGGYSAFAAISPTHRVATVLSNTAGGGGGTAFAAGQLLAPALSPG